MKRLFFLLTLVFGLGSVSLYAQENKEESKKESKEAKKEAKEAKKGTTTEFIKEIVDGKRYIIYCDRMQPQRGRSRTIGREHTLEMKGDVFCSSLPYFGVAHSMASYDGLNILDFEKEYTNYKCKVTKKGKVIVSFNIRNGQELLDYTLTFYSNGSVDIYINPMRRDPVSFSGELGYKRKLTVQ